MSEAAAQANYAWHYRVDACTYLACAPQPEADVRLRRLRTRPTEATDVIRNAAPLRSSAPFIDYQKPRSVPPPTRRSASKQTRASQPRWRPKRHSCRASAASLRSAKQRRSGDASSRTRCAGPAVGPDDPQREGGREREGGMRGRAGTRGRNERGTRGRAGQRGRRDWGSEGSE
eukprot:365867-Chlamydomonas_euryale.AAC.3